MKTHNTSSYILSPAHKVTVHLVGVGGTGSQVLSGLARIHKGLQALNHPGIHVRAFDPDAVSGANIGRQMFSAADLYLNKAKCAITRINRFFGYDWEAHPEFYDATKSKSNIVITCVDSAKARIQISKQLKKKNGTIDPMEQSFYWLDFGNLKTTGQVILGTTINYGLKDIKLLDGMNVIQLPTVTDHFDLRKVKETDQGPSCSLAEAIGKQDLFINSTLAQLGCNLLWKLFTQGRINYRGIYLNLETMQTRPIPIN